MFFNLIEIIFFILFVSNTKSSRQGDEVSKWADAIGKELWTLGSYITRFSQQRDKLVNIEVQEKNPHLVLAEIKEDISRMIDRKADAIRCIQEKAEKEAAALEFNKSVPFSYYSSKYSQIEGRAEIKLPESLLKNNDTYKTLTVNNDTHFYYLAVNTNYSSVHVPTNIYDKDDAPSFAIQWSEALDDVFRQNYKSDPSLSWQYFGSTTGIMRHFPAKRWDDDTQKTDLFDCRIRTWFIEAATCTKDAVILVDNSGSMDGMGHHIASLTASSILDTFSNNDFINVLNYSVTTNYTVPCFADMLVQATEENIAIFKNVIQRLEPEGKTNVEEALQMAFDLLEKYREIRNCTADNKSCNQAIMIITDGINRNISDIVMRNENNTSVRLFTYLIGKEVTNVEEIKWVSCANRGYYTHVQSLEQVTVSVLKYINVIARPLVLQKTEHPVSWTHAYADLTYQPKDTPLSEPFRLLTSAAIPCYDTKTNEKNDTRTAFLLGIAGTDVPLDEFHKLMFPYKIGVNAYGFIVSNNGYVLMHPDLRPVFKGILKENYNSIDLVQVEQHDDGSEEPRQIGETLKKLRDALVYGKNGSITNVKLKYHYDDMKRVSEEYYDYYFAPLEDTPFTIGIGIPNPYGKYMLKVDYEINPQGERNITSFFNGKWKIHPKWVYCKYHYLEGHEFNTPEEELTHFLGKMYDRQFKWKRQYEASKTNVKNEYGFEKEDLSGVQCGRTTLGDDDYYCDKQLVQILIYDAKNTHEFFSDKWIFDKSELPLFKRYNASLRFVATMSGLTRWDYVFEENENSPKANARKEFGDHFPRAIGEKWYKDAVLQHHYDNESFVFSVPFDANFYEDILVTASYAIFPSVNGLEAPALVVGYQFSQANLRAKVNEISTNTTNQCPHCAKCDTTLDCYVVDSSGYIIVSESLEDTGKFFGEVEGDILQSMLNENIFKKITVYDYQALCTQMEDNSEGGAPKLFNPLNYIQFAINWIFMKLAYFIMQLNISSILNSLAVYSQDIFENNTGTELDLHLSKMVNLFKDILQNISDNTTDNSDASDKPAASDGATFNKSDSKQNEPPSYYACENKIDLYVLQQNLFIKDKFHGEVNEEGWKNNTRNYFVKRIPFTNLIFVAINSSFPVKQKKYYTTVPQQITKEPVYDINFMNKTLLPCQKLNLNNLPRRRLKGCFNEHYLEHEIVDCGGAGYVKLNLYLLLFTFGIKYYTCF